jgi:hypothetical protein
VHRQREAPLRMPKRRSDRSGSPNFIRFMAASSGPLQSLAQRALGVT